VVSIFSAHADASPPKRARAICPFQGVNLFLWNGVKFFWYGWEPLEACHRYCTEFLCAIARPNLSVDRLCFPIPLVSKACLCEMIAGLSQAQQQATRQQTMANKLRIMVQELANSDVTRGEILDRVYTKCGCVQSLDGTRVCIVVWGIWSG